MIIYGAGFVGLVFCKMLINNGISPTCIIDGNEDKIGKMWCDIPVLSIRDSRINKDEKVIISIIDYGKIKKEIQILLEGCGFKYIQHIFDYAQINDNSLLFNQQPLIFKIDDYLLKNNKLKISRVQNILSDTKSVETYNSIVDVFLSKNLLIVPSLPIEWQYMFPFRGDSEELGQSLCKMENEVIIDIGAGPKFELISNMNAREVESVKKIYLIDMDYNIGKLNICDSLKDKCVVINKAIIDSEDVVFYTNYWGMNSLISADGDNIADVVILDDIITEKVTFIKIDIEGYEIDAIHSAINIISNCRPILACAIYHSVSEFWEVPILLKKTLLDYRFYVRSYCNINETIFYAIPEERIDYEIY